MTIALVDLWLYPAFHNPIRIILLVSNDGAELEVRVAEDSLSAEIPYTSATDLLGAARGAIYEAGHMRSGVDGIRIEFTVETDLEPSVRVKFWSPKRGSQCTHLVKSLLAAALYLPKGNRFEQALKDAQSYFH